MGIEDIEIGCDSCKSTIRQIDNCYCEDCLDKKDGEIDDLQKKVESLEADCSFYESEAVSYRDEIKQLKEGE